MPVFTTYTVSAASTTNSAVSPWIPLDQFSHPFNVGFTCTKEGTGEVTYKVQHTMENVLGGVTPSAGTIFDHSDVSGATGNRDGNYAFPVAAVRLQVVSGSSDFVTIRLRQAGL